MGAAAGLPRPSRPGRDETATKRREADAAHIIAGVVDGHTTGAPIAAIIENTNTRSKDYLSCAASPVPDMRTSLRA